MTRLTPNEENYLSKIPESKIAHIFPCDLQVVGVVEGIRKKLKHAGIDYNVHWIGASVLGIAGQNDLDLHILSKPLEWEEVSEKVSSVFDDCIQSISIYQWEFEINGFEVELYLSDPQSDEMMRQISVFNILRNDESLRSEYEKIKLNSNGISFREYMKRKYEFYHRILDEEFSL